MVNAADHARFMSTKQFGSLDGLRALSIVAVIFHHTTTPIAAFPATGRGFLGVDLFFEISGFLIVTLLLREQRKTGTISLTSFWKRRALRIFPLLLAVLLGLGAISLALPQAQALADIRRELPYALLYISNWVPMTSLIAITWSLSAEEQFYIVWPPIQRALRGGAVVLVVVLIATCVGLQFARPPVAFLAEASFTPILLGVLLAHLLDDPKTFAIVARVSFAPAWALVIAVLVSIENPDISGLHRFGIHVALFFFLASCVCREDHVFTRLFRIIGRVGVLSYGLYLLHMIARHGAMKIVGEPGLPLFLLTLVIALVMAELSYRFYESPFLRAKTRLHAPA